MKKNKKLDKHEESATVKILKLSHDGRGIAAMEKTTFISGALPGEIVSCKITQQHSRFNEAEILQLVSPAKERAVPPCNHFGLCGGCSLQHMDAQSQIELKQQTLIEQLKHFGKVTPDEILPPLTADTIGYRRKARLGVKFVIKKDKLLVGFREKSSNYLADLSHCAVLHPKIGERFLELSDLIRSLTCYRQIPQVEVAIGDQEAALVFRHLAPLTLEDELALKIFGEKYQFHIYLQPNSPDPIHKLWPTSGLDRLAYTLQDYQLEFLFHPLDFTQVNLAMNRMMVKQVLTLLAPKPHETVLDLFCGIGNFTLPFARFAKHVTGVEGSEEMVRRANENARHNKIENVEFHAANLMKPNENATWINAQYDIILLDPPRAGAIEILPYFSQFAAKKIGYISCNPATLARDAQELTQKTGYSLKKTGVINMFPHTSHIEALAIFEKI